MKPHRRKPSNRAGYALVLFLMIFFGLMGLAALVIDMGFARLAQRQMQTAVDSAALEGLRWRDYLIDQSTDQSRDEYRRQKASDMVANVFDDDLNPANGDPMSFGAGPVVQFQGGNPTLPTASQQLIVPATPVYKPQRSDKTPGLELNDSSNAPKGDMASGTYNVGQSSDEADDYTRADFSYAPPGSDPSASNAFLVRMRRTPLGNIPGSMDNTPGVSSTGPTLPVLFGRGSLMAQSGGNGQLSVASGITVRATAIAAAMPAKSVGPAYTTTSGTLTAIPQLAPFAIKNDYWNDVVWPQLSSGIAVPVDAQHLMLLTADFCASLTAIGQPLGTLSPTLAPGTGNYVPIYDDDFTTKSATIIGFVYVKWSPSGATSVTLNPPTDMSHVSHVGSQNVSGTIALSLPPNLTQQDISLLFQDHAALTNPLYAPVLVNHYIGP